MGILSEKIEHIVVLMQENRSFDSMLGTLYPKSPKFNGLSGHETNPQQGQPDVSVWTSDATDTLSMKIPDPDPGESWDDMNMQLFGLNETAGEQPPPMNGFVNNYVQQSNLHAKHSKAPMHYYTEKQLPILHQLAKQFAVSDQYFASAPCQTYPNRFFAHCGTAGGYVNNTPFHFPYLMKSIFNCLSEANISWGIYYNEIPHSLALTKLWPFIDNFHPIEQFTLHAKNGTLPAYTFIEPRFFPDIAIPTDQHPPVEVNWGEDLIANVYNIVRSSPLGKKPC